MIHVVWDVLSPKSRELYFCPYPSSFDSTDEVWQVRVIDKGSCPQQVKVLLEGVPASVRFGHVTMLTFVYIKLYVSEQLLLSEGVCRQVKILAYHPDVLGKGSSHSARARDSNPPMQFLRVVYHSRRRRPYHMSLLTVVLTRLVDPWAPFFVTPTCVVLASVPIHFFGYPHLCRSAECSHISIVAGSHHSRSLVPCSPWLYGQTFCTIEGGGG